MLIPIDQPQLAETLFQTSLSKEVKKKLTISESYKDYVPRLKICCRIIKLFKFFIELSFSSVQNLYVFGKALACKKQPSDSPA